MRDLRLLVCQLHELRVRLVVPQRQRQDPHQRSISVGVLTSPARAERGRTLLEGAQCFAGLKPAIEDAAIDSHVPLLLPGKEPAGEIVRVEAIALEQRREEAQRVRAVVRPGTGRRPVVRSIEPEGWNHLDRVGWRQGPGLVKLVGDSEGVADEQPPDAAAHAIGDEIHERTFHGESILPAAGTRGREIGGHLFFGRRARRPKTPIHVEPAACTCDERAFIALARSAKIPFCPYSGFLGRAAGATRRPESTRRGGRPACKVER
jgi:hypothetical protein